jgi:hypothetical protein
MRGARLRVQRTPAAARVPLLCHTDQHQHPFHPLVLLAE